MFKNKNFSKYSIYIIGAMISCGSASSQQLGTIEEIAELNRQKVISDLRKQIDLGKTSDKSLEVTKEASSKIIHPIKENVDDQIPEVVSIYGVRPDALYAVISNVGNRNMRVRAGESSANGWEVEKITPTFVVFRKAQKSNSSTKSGSKKIVSKTSDDSPTYKRVTVGLSPMQRSASNPAGISGAMPSPMFPQGPLIQGMGYSQPQAPLMMQLPPAATLPVPPQQIGVR